MAGLFEGPAPHVRAIPASAAFLDVLADAMANEFCAGGDPFALADALVLLPNRRSARGLIDALARRLGGAALLPAIRPLGDPHADDDPDVWGAEPAGADIAPPIDRTRRRMMLAQLIRGRDAARGMADPSRALALADELAKLLDSAATVERAAWEKLPTLVDNIELARHWAENADFLDIVATYWPQCLQELGLSDPAAHGSAVRLALAERWQTTPPAHPVIVAGSTGSIATTRALMRVVAGLPRGVVVLPGLDADLDDASWRELGDQHPQFALRETLAALGLERGPIASLGVETGGGRARRLLMREALAPPAQTADWLARLDAAGGADFAVRGASGVRLIEAATEDEEAAAIALLLREALETSGRTAALVTPDAGLARRVEAKLARWDAAPAVSHGRPLRETEAGRLIGLLCELAADPSEPVALAALLKHPRVRLADMGGLVALEHRALRGARRWQSLAELAALEELEKSEPARALVARLEAALAPMTQLGADELLLGGFADAVAAVIETLAGRLAWSGRDGELAANMLRDLIGHGDALGPMPAYAAPRVLMQAMRGREVAPAPGGDARIAIWGPMEARLQRRDLIVLGGLNEGVWPAAPGEDPFLSRPMRQQLGLPSLEQRIGLAAHDFAQLANAPEVVLSRALRRDGSPTVASRWLWRLQTLLRGAGVELAPADEYLRWARRLDARAPPRAACAPRPRPPAGKRLERLSVTQVETLIRDPYAVYARRILGLECLKPVGAAAGPAERGTAVHRAIERFADADDPVLLADLLDEELRKAGLPAERRAAERARLAQSVEALIGWFAQRRSWEVEVKREVKGKVSIAGVELRATADRIAIGASGASILDFKTGAPPTAAQVQSGLAPQLPLEAAMLERGGFAELAPARAAELLYWRFGGSEPTPAPLALDPGAEADNAWSRLEQLLNRYASPEQPFLSKPRVMFVKPYADYDHLARRKEWADAEGEE